MNGKRFLPLLATLAVLVAACTQKNSDDLPNTTTGVPTGLNRFLLFPNPLAINTGGFETNTSEYADAYYRAIDPTNAKNTIDKWKTQNSFGSGTGTELLAVFRDTKDLGYGRRMTGRMNTDGSVAFYVENYSVTPNASGDYSSVLNVEAAIRRDTRWHVGTNAIEWSSTPCIAGVDPPDCNGTIKFAKYYNFSSQDGTRQLAVDLDGNGLKAMPGPCITCHGGRGDPLTPPDASTGKPRFPLVENSISRKRGDVQARLHGMNVDSFGYSPDIAGFSKADQQAKLKQFNQWILCTYPLAGAAAGAEDNCRVPAGPNEWQGTAAEMIKAWYGGPGMPNGTFLDSYVPAGWASNTSLYTGVVAPYCRTCHILRGTKNQDDIDFTKLGTPAVGSTPATGFQSYADRIKAHVFDRGTMPLALIVYDAFWSSNAPNQLATFINPLLTPPQTVLDASGVALRPGRSLADAGPTQRMVRTGANVILTAEDSLFPTLFTWSQDPANPTGATISNANSMIATFSATFPGTYTVRLSVGNDPSDDAKVTITVDDNFPDPVKFAHVKNVLQNVLHNGTTKCTSCHTSPAVSPTPPIFYNNFDRDGLGGATADATDEAWFLKALSGRVNLTEIQASPLLRKPSGNHHNGGTLLNLATAAGLHDYSILFNWILAGMPAGGVAADAIVNNGVLGSAGSPVLFTFSGPVGGPYASPNIPLDGSQSLGATTYSWTVFGPPGPLGTEAVITNPTSANATLNVFNVGTYIVQLQVTDGTTNNVDTVQRTMVVGENPITASFSPTTGNSAVTFSGSPARGVITLTSLSAGSPTSCRWQILGGPANSTLGTFPTIVVDQTRSCASPATLSVPVSAIGSAYSIQLTASNIGSSTVPNFITISNGTPVTASISVTSSTSLVFGGNPPQATVSLSGTASTGVLPLTYAWSVTAQPSGATTNSTVTSGASTSTLTAKATGSYTIQLKVTDATATTATTTSIFSVTPFRGTTFATMTADFASFGCVGCHSFFSGFNNNPDPATNNTGNTTNNFRPSWEDLSDVNGKTLWQRVFQRVVPGNAARSLILLNPQNINNGFNDNPIGAGYTTPHGGGCQTNFGCGIGDSSRLTIFSNWVLDGAPPGQ
jgi:hypothetical protein